MLNALPVRLFVLVVPLITTMACVTIDGPRRQLSERLVETQCEPGRPTAVLDSSMRDRVRLVFSKTEHCTESWETSYEKEQRWRLNDGVRGALAIGAGLIVAVPLVALTVAAGQPTGTSRAALGPDHAEPAYHPIPGAIGEPIVYGIIIAGAGAGAAAYEAMRATDPRPSIHVAERTKKLQLHERVVDHGTVNGPGLDIGGLQLTAGALELSLDEAQGLSDGELYLDGVRVELLGEVSEWFGFLLICTRAVDATGSDFESWSDATRAAPWKLAEACDRRGWTFAEYVRVNAIRPRR